MNTSIEKLATPGDIESLLIRARATASKAYAPYSKFSVGAVLVDRDGNELIGCNVENASYGITLCAERVAGTAAISQGSRSWSKLVIVSPTGLAEPVGNS